MRTRVRGAYPPLARAGAGLHAERVRALAQHVRRKQNPLRVLACARPVLLLLAATARQQRVLLALRDEKVTPKGELRARGVTK
eukprot:971677-Prorocentrum_minimum.AAC.2